MKATLLLVDDDPLDVIPLRMLLEDEGHEVLVERSAAAALATIERHPVDLVISDVSMPRMSGNDLMLTLREKQPGLPVILYTGKGSIRNAVDAMKHGAFDYVTKPADASELRVCVARALEHGRLRRENASLRAELGASGRYGERLLGRSPAMLAVFETINRIARTDSTVLITGETGTGKELIAQTIHYKSRRAAAPLVAFNCAALNPNLVESELFGHEKGAFTGAASARRGRFEEADGGTILLDEIGETSPAFQVKLLRVLQERCIERVGGSARTDVNVRVIASTNCDLEALVREGKFREDLFYRLRVIPIHLPPLRERRDDILPLAEHFLATLAARYNLPAPTFSPRAAEFLVAHTWPGNVRELEHAVERAVLLARGTSIEPEDLSSQTTARSPGSTGGETLQDRVDRASREHVLEILDRTGWHKQQAAELLGIDRVTLYRLLKKYGLEKDG